MQEEADKAAALAAKKAARLEDQLRAAMAEKEVLVTQSAEASAKVAAAQAARDRAVKEVSREWPIALLTCGFEVLLTV